MGRSFHNYSNTSPTLRTTKSSGKGSYSAKTQQHYHAGPHAISLIKMWGRDLNPHQSGDVTRNFHLFLGSYFVLIWRNVKKSNIVNQILFERTRYILPILKEVMVNELRSFSFHIHFLRLKMNARIEATVTIIAIIM